VEVRSSGYERRHQIAYYETLHDFGEWNIHVALIATALSHMNGVMSGHEVYHRPSEAKTSGFIKSIPEGASHGLSFLFLVLLLRLQTLRTYSSAYRDTRDWRHSSADKIKLQSDIGR
jgi:hypothetical protein